MVKILEGADADVARWVWAAYRLRPITLDRAIGILDDSGKIVGAILLSNHNGFNVDFGYYGRNTITVGICRWIAQLGMTMNISRATMLTPKKNKPILKFWAAIGGHLEGVSRRYYGDEDCPRNTAVRFVVFREQLKRFAYGPNHTNSTIGAA